MRIDWWHQFYQACPQGISRFRSGWVLLGLLSLLLPVHGQQFSAYVSQNPVAVGQRFQLSFRLDDASGEEVSFPPLNDFQRIMGPQQSSSQQVSVVNGKMTRTFSLTFDYVLVPKKAGTFTIGSASVVVDGKTLRTKPIELQVVDGGSSTNKQAAGSSGNREQEIRQTLKKLIYVKAYLTKRQMYQGEQFAISYKLFQRADIAQNIRGLKLEEAPGYEGFWAENVELKNPQATLEVINGQQFYVRTIKQDILIPQRAGRLKIEPLTLSMVVPIPRQRQQRRRRNPRDPFADFDDLFDMPFQRYENFPFFAVNEALQVQVKPLPASGKPDDFSGIVGELSLDASLDQEAVEVDQGLTLKLVFRGEGDLNKIQAPSLDFHPDLEDYPPDESRRISKSGGKISGSKTFDYLLIPRNPGTYELPEVSLSYFDPKQGRYQRAKSDKLEVMVGGEARKVNPASATPITQVEVEQEAESIRYIYDGPISFRRPNEPWLGTGMFWLSLLLPLLGFAGLFWWKQRRDRAQADVVGTRQRRATRTARRRLAQAQVHLKAGTEKPFYNEVVRSVWGYLSDKLVMGQSELSRDNIREKLQVSGVPEAQQEALIQLLDTCEMALFAPQAAEGGMEGTYAQAAQLIIDLERDLS